MLNSLIYEMPDLFFCSIPQIVFLRGIIFSKFAKKCKHLALLARCMSACGLASGRATEGAIKHYFSLLSANGRDSKNVMDII